mmetsp:Transcript_4727/g.8938  ORF Transcript_4727/g.8938 Transcript_4727/m.8938 type:complete len:188 (-) Transcript_4727:228-791(-)
MRCLRLFERMFVRFQSVRHFNTLANCSAQGSHPCFLTVSRYEHLSVQPPIALQRLTPPSLVRLWASYTDDDNAFESERMYHQVADRTLDDLHERIEEFVEGQNVEDSDVEYSMGVLTIKLGNKGTLVLNKQAPNRQIWLSSPISGPVRYDYDKKTGCWVYQRNGTRLRDLLQSELSQLCGGNLSLSQ